MWYPSRIAFGKFKGRQFQDALTDPELHRWLKWLAEADNPRSAEMGNWYLRQLEVHVEKPTQGGFVVGSAVSDSGEVTIFKDPEIERLQLLIDASRDQLATLEADYTSEHHAVSVIRSKLFSLLREHYQRRDELSLIVDYRRKFIEMLMVSGEEEAEELAEEFAEAKEQTEQDYEEAAAEAQDKQELTEEEEKELKALFRKLARLYHPDRFAQEPEKQEIYTRLMAEINKAKDRGDIVRLREIASDPEGFIVAQGWGSLDLDDDAGLGAVRQHYDNLQARILDMIDAVTELRESGDYELYRLSLERPEFIQEIAEQQAEEIKVQIRELEDEAAALANEIENLTGEIAPFG